MTPKINLGVPQAEEKSLEDDNEEEWWTLYEKLRAEFGKNNPSWLPWLHGDVDEDTGELGCALCFDFNMKEPNDDNKVVMLEPCNHVYCLGCVKDLRDCPTCITKITKKPLIKDWSAHILDNAKKAKRAAKKLGNFRWMEGANSIKKREAKKLANGLTFDQWKELLG